MSIRVVIGIILIIYVIAKMHGLGAPSTPKEKYESLIAIRDIVFYGSFVVFGIGLIFYRPTGDGIHPIWYCLLALQLALFFTWITLKIMRVEKTYGYGPTKREIADMRRAYEADEFIREVRAHELVDVPRMAANPFDPEYTMEPEQRCDPDVVAEWRRMGKPIATKHWESRY